MFSIIASQLGPALHEPTKNDHAHVIKTRMQRLLKAAIFIAVPLARIYWVDRSNAADAGWYCGHLRWRCAWDTRYRSRDNRRFGRKFRDILGEFAT